MATINGTPMQIIQQIHQIQKLRDMNLEPRSTMVLTKTYRTLLAYEVFEHVTQDIASFLSLQDILALTQVCQASRSWRSKIFSTFVTHLLKKWVSEPLSLRKVMHKTGSLISGSSVVWFLQRGPSNWSPGDLDVYTAYGRSGPIIDFFLKEGYTITRSPPEREDATYLVESTQLIKVTKLQKGEQKVDVLEGVSMYAMKPLLSFHTTVVMNYIAASSIGMLYPKPFFQNKGIIRDYKYQTDDHPWEDKYRDRSFTLARRVSEPCDLVLCPNLLRRPYDCHTLMVELPLDLEDDDDDNSTMDEDDIDIEAESQALKWILKIEKGGHDRCNEYECVFKDFGKLFGDHSAIMPLIVRHCYASVMWHVGQLLKEHVGPMPYFLESMDSNLRYIIPRIRAILRNSTRMVSWTDLEGYQACFKPQQPTIIRSLRKRRGPTTGEPMSS